MKRAGRSNIATVPGVLEHDSARVRDELVEALGVRDGHELVLGAPVDERGAGDLLQSVLEAVAGECVQSADEARALGRRDLLGDEAGPAAGRDAPRPLPSRACADAGAATAPRRGAAITPAPIVTSCSARRSAASARLVAHVGDADPGGGDEDEALDALRGADRELGGR